ncbi:hypothetical protein H2198_005383 [Neophaeococcomyces mojaviensis]|uniref:Uncharacterized protein n=1 Tax=Neophaeococcomyces mojaviensis TaxID=3383035 RepID=A0ACC3A5T5_9EURO|nr:hypothetical protein H2198_005383 [Knufia sp. JES_112]
MTAPVNFQPKAIVFDLLTGLLNSWTVWDASIPSSERHIASGQTWRKHYLDVTYNIPGHTYTPYEDLVRRSAAEIGLSSAAPMSLIKHMDDIKPWAEVPVILEQLRKQGIKLGVVTNCSNELGHRMISNVEKIVREQTEDKEFTFDVTVTAEESGFYKPNPKPYQDALKKLGVEADETLFVAGSSGDIPGASNVGMKVVWNNHVGLERKNNVLPLREGRDLKEALGDTLN